MSNHQKLENNLNAPHWEMDEESGAHYTVELLSSEKGWTTDARDHVEERQIHDTGWK